MRYLSLLIVVTLLGFAGVACTDSDASPGAVASPSASATVPSANATTVASPASSPTTAPAQPSATATTAPQVAPAATVTATVAGPTLGNTLVLSRQDDKGTFKVNTGSLVAVSLADNMNWRLEVTDDSVLVADNGGRLGADIIGTYRAAKTGTADIKATGTAKCAPGVVCPQFAVLVSFTINVP